MSTITLSPLSYARKLRSWGGAALVCNRCKLAILPGELNRWTMVPEHEQGVQCVRAKAQKERNLNVSNVTVRNDETLEDAISRTTAEVSEFLELMSTANT